MSSLCSIYEFADPFSDQIVCIFLWIYQMKSRSSKEKTKSDFYLIYPSVPMIFRFFKIESVKSKFLMKFLRNRN